MSTVRVEFLSLFLLGNVTSTNFILALWAVFWLPEVCIYKWTCRALAFAPFCCIAQDNLREIIAFRLSTKGAMVRLATTPAGTYQTCG
jgi:hypothetical protein